MVKAARYAEPMVDRRVFTRWSITIPVDMDETFVASDGYWHAWEADRSISLTSMIVADRRGRPVPMREILDRMPAMEGEGMPLPDHLDGWAVVINVPDSPRASRAISGILVLDGNLLMVTVTSDDLDWATSIWRSIRHEAGRTLDRKRPGLTVTSKNEHGGPTMRITSKGQVTIPQDLRERTGLLPETEVEFVLDGRGVRIIKASAARQPTRGAKAVRLLRAKRPVVQRTTDEIMALTRGD